MVWAGVRLAGRDGDAPTFATDDPGVSHVHGLGVNPGDGRVYVATHYGTFRLAGDGKAERVGESFQDTMGFTVAGSDRFLGSGHPDTEGFRRGQPPLLGLIESTDGGATWRSLSLSGEVDFHALAAAHGRVYGWDSTSSRFMVSTDRRTWETRSTRPLLSFAVDPADAEHLVATAPDGVLDSADGGRSWRTLSPAPALVTLSWDPAGGLVGAEEGGTVHRSADRGASWERVGRIPGSPQALLATADALYAAAHDSEGTTGIYRSSDGGSTWPLYYRDRP
jgi:Neuraminidase (sialidase)